MGSDVDVEASNMDGISGLGGGSRDRANRDRVHGNDDLRRNFSGTRLCWVVCSVRRTMRTDHVLRLRRMKPYN